MAVAVGGHQSSCSRGSSSGSSPIDMAENDNLIDTFLDF